MGKYLLQRLIDHDHEKRLETWKTIAEGDDYEALVQLCPIGYRLVDKATNKVVHQP